MKRSSQSRKILSESIATYSNYEDVAIQILLLDIVKAETDPSSEYIVRCLADICSLVETLCLHDHSLNGISLETMRVMSNTEDEDPVATFKNHAISLFGHDSNINENSIRELLLEWSAMAIFYELEEDALYAFL